MTTTDNPPNRHPANAVFALMDDREFRYSIIRPALAKDKDGLCRLTTGKHQLRGFRHMNRAPNVMIVPVLSDEANVSAELAKKLLEYWLEDNVELKNKVAAKLTELGYQPADSTFDIEGEIGWHTIAADHANLQYDGEFLPDEDKNHVMLMSLLLGWFGAEEQEEEEEQPQPVVEETKKDDPAPEKKTSEKAAPKKSKVEKTSAPKEDTPVEAAPKKKSATPKAKPAESDKSGKTVKTPKKPSATETKGEDAPKKAASRKKS